MSDTATPVNPFRVGLLLTSAMSRLVSAARDLVAVLFDDELYNTLTPSQKLQVDRLREEAKHLVDTTLVEGDCEPGEPGSLRTRVYALAQELRNPDGDR